MRKIPNETRVADLVGKDVVLKSGAVVASSNAAAEFLLPPGMVVHAEDMGRALHLVTPPCPACGVGVRLRNVPRRWLALAGPEDLETGYPVRAGWQERPDGTCACTRCGFGSSRGDDPGRDALDAGGKVRWRFCPGCGAGMRKEPYREPGPGDRSVTT